MMSHDGPVERVEVRHVIFFIGMDLSFYIMTNLKDAQKVFQYRK